MNVRIQRCDLQADLLRTGIESQRQRFEQLLPCRFGAGFGAQDLRELRKFAMMHSPDAARADLSEYSEANIQFHQRILELSGCSLLKTTADGLFEHMHAARRRAMGESDRASRSVVDHMGIIEALEVRDGDLAECLVREHTMRLHDHIRKTWTRLEGRGSGTVAVGTH